MKNTYVLFLIAFLLSSCAPAATAVPASTVISTQTATLTPTNTPTPTNTAVPTITPTPLPITFIYQDNYPTNARLITEQAAAKTYLRISQYAGLGQITIYTISDINQYIDEIFPMIKADLPNATKSQFIQEWPYTDGTAVKGLILINSGYSASDDELNFCGKTRIIAHEMFHLLQRQLVGHSLDRKIFDRGPDWIIEGSAEAMSFRLVDGLNECDDQKSGPDFWRTDASVDGAPLGELDGFDAHQKSKFYSVSSWAMDYLIRTTPEGEQAIISFYSEIGNGKPWRDAFTSAFGMEVEKYYDDFEKIQANQLIVPDTSVCLPQSDKRVICLGLINNNGSADYIFEIPFDGNSLPPADQWSSSGSCVVTGWGGTPKSKSTFELAISFDPDTHGICHINIIFSADQQITVDLAIP
ncbi:MAG: hypothetical protein IT314_12530 [Anaerolineales bacterium]|nr:hypothetical protein [Anaerolineales bacterium]